MVVTMGPPCTAFANWSRLNRVINALSWRKAHADGKRLADFAVEVAFLQLDGHRHFLIENPRGSDIFKLRSFQRLWRTRRCFSMNIPQCALGLVVCGEPILKWTTLWASSPLLLKPFEGLKCTHSSHGLLRRAQQDQAGAGVASSYVC